MKKKQIVDLVIDLLLIGLGVVLLLLAFYGISDIKNLFFGIMCGYALLNGIQFILTKESKDYEGLYTLIISMSIGIVGLFFDFSSPLQLSLSLISWVFLMSMAKLVKTSYYNDRRDRMWKIRVFTLIMFILLGILTSINLYHSKDIQVLILGFFFFTHGLLETIDPIVKSLLQE